ncbi:MAG TPA: hypothetical protein VGD48_15150 [Kutzneria sp.]
MQIRVLGTVEAAGGLVIVVDDLHRADPASLLLFNHLARGTTGVPLLPRRRLLRAVLGRRRPLPRRRHFQRRRRPRAARRRGALPTGPGAPAHRGRGPRQANAIAVRLGMPRLTARTQELLTSHV